MQLDAKANGDLLKRFQAGIIFDSQFVKLIELVIKSATFGSFLLRPMAFLPQRADAVCEQR